MDEILQLFVAGIGGIVASVVEYVFLAQFFSAILPELSAYPLLQAILQILTPDGTALMFIILQWITILGARIGVKL